MIYIDLDGVLVEQKGRSGFDKMPWTKEGRELWAMLAKYRPVLISTAARDHEMEFYEQKRTWVDRELGTGYRLFVMSDEVGKALYSSPGHVLIDNDPKQKGPWEAKGGFFVLYKRASQTIADMVVKGLI